jgi:hypothetical protein
MKAEVFNMGSQFWWFYDVIVVAVALVCIFIGSRKGVMKGVFGFVSVIIAAVLAYVISGAVGDTVSSGLVCESNAKKISESIDESTFMTKYINYLENMGYSVSIDENKLGAALDKGEGMEEAVVFYLNSVNGHSLDKKEVLLEKMHEGYGIILSDIVSKSLNEFAAVKTKEIISEKPEMMEELIPMLRDEEQIFQASLYISKNMAAPAYNIIGRLVSYLVIFAVIALGLLLGINAFFSHKEVEAIGVVSHVAGGIFGLFTAAGIVFAIAVWVRVSAITGNNEMLFFNNDVVEKSYLFKYFYDFAMKM